MSSAEDEFITNISECLDNILNISSEEWTQKQSRLYNLLSAKVEKYRETYNKAQYKLDERDIKNNVKKMKWYEDSPYKRTIDWCLDQLVIKSYQKTQKTKDFKIIIKFTTVKALVCILYKETQFQYKLKTPNYEGELSLKNMPSVAKAFGLDDSIPLKHKKQATIDIIKTMEEIGLFYVPESEEQQ